jgi:hypothetical protein
MAIDLVRHVIRRRIQAGSLPCHRTIELWQAFGFGQICDACGVAITSSDWMYLICGDHWRAIRLHEECFVIWQDEKRTIT